MLQMFQYEVWSPSTPVKLNTVDYLIDCDFTLRIAKLGNLTLCVCYLVRCAKGIQCVCALMVTIIHIILENL